jgi:cytochrome P450
MDTLLFERRAAEEAGDYEKVQMLSDDNIIGVVNDLFAGGTDTTSTVLEWLILFMANNPDKQIRLQEELDEAQRE